MRTRSLKWLACPSRGCRGPIVPTDAIQPVCDLGDPEEIYEGLVRCRSCGTEYPVLLGVAILQTDLSSYLCAFWDEIESCAASLDSPVSRRMCSYLGVPGAFTGLARPTARPKRSLEWTTSPYLQAHYDPGSLTAGLPAGWWKGAVERHLESSHDPYAYLLEAVRHMTGGSGSGLAVEVGCNVGRGSGELAGCYEYSIGVDLSFRAVLTARQLHLGKPRPQERYPVQEEQGLWEDRQLGKREPCGNLDFVVGSAEELPVAGSAVACVAALNVLCAVSDPAGLLSELRRVLAPGGALAMSSPYWPENEGDTPFRQGGPSFVHDRLGDEFTFVAEDDMVPWVLRLGKRRWNVYLCHCVVATKKETSTSDDRPAKSPEGG